ncbi:MAG: hypothetical protein HY877_06660 [Deltaproteobacteria bacterium]|nr:hypothetical protein [Deltaproteobacteria bacterium]
MGTLKDSAGVPMTQFAINPVSGSNSQNIFLPQSDFESGSGGDVKKPKFRLAVMPFKLNKGADESLAQSIYSLVTDRLSVWEELEVTSFDDIGKVVGFKKAAQMAGCKDEICIKEFSKDNPLGVDYLVTGTLSLLGNTYVVSLQLIALQKTVVENRIQLRVENGGKSHFTINEVNDAADKLVSPFFKKSNASSTSMFSWVSPAVNAITSRPYRSLMWTSFAASVGGLVVGGMNRGYANSDEDQHIGLVRQLQSEGKIVGTSGNLRFADDATKSAYSNQIDGLRQSAENHAAISTAGFVGAAVFAGLGALLWHLDSNGQNQKTGPKMSLQLSESGTRLSLGGTF